MRDDKEPKSIEEILNSMFHDFKVEQSKTIDPYFDETVDVIDVEFELVE